MNIEQTKKAIEVMQAFVDGKKIETKGPGEIHHWYEIGDPSWNWLTVEYRVKREPRVIYVHVSGGLQTYLPVSMEGWVKFVEEL
jgi:hypothetical protein